MSDLGGRTVFVTGIAGFVGANLARRLLADGALVHGLVRPGRSRWRLHGLQDIRLHEADVLDREAVARGVREAQPDLVFHLAAEGGHPRDAASRRRALEVAGFGTLNLLEALASARSLRRLVWMGSSLEVGPARPAREADPMRPVTFRGVAKAVTAVLCAQFARSSGWSAAGLRVFSVYGPWEQATRLVPTAVLCALRGTEMSLTTPGHGRDFVFVDDVVDAAVRAAQAELPEGETVINVGSGRFSTNEELLAAVGAAAGSPVRVRDVRYPDTLGPIAVADTTRARRLLGWEATSTLAGGIARTVDWFRGHAHLYERP